ncbi:MAG: J domain-containing protein [Cocleimonas sp.]
MKLTQLEALAILGLPLNINQVHANGISIKKAYKIAALKSHPDRDGCGDQMVKINEAYNLLKSLFDVNQVHTNIVRDDIYANNEGHKLYSAGIPAFKPLKQLLREALDIRDDLDKMPGTWAVHDSALSNKVFFQYLGDDFEVSWNHDNIYIDCITNAGRMGKVCSGVQISVSEWKCDDCSMMLINVFDLLLNNPIFHEGSAENGFSWAVVYEQITKSINEAVSISDTEMKATFFEHSLTFKQERYSYNRWRLDLPVASVSIYLREEKAVGVFNPYKLDLVYKPLTKIPNKFKTVDLIKVLVNGQFAEFKRNYYHTDDYAYDNAVDSRRGFIDNPTKAIIDWIEDRGRCKSDCARVYLRDQLGMQCVSFGFHSNDCSSLNLVLSNTYPVVDLSDDVVRINESLKLAC